MLPNLLGLRRHPIILALTRFEQTAHLREGVRKNGLLAAGDPGLDEQDPPLDLAGVLGNLALENVQQAASVLVLPVEGMEDEVMSRLRLIQLNKAFG